MRSDTLISPPAPSVAAAVSVAVPPAARPHVPSLDGLRGLAVLVVVGVHARVPGTELGFLGVDLFFVLSGFLITTLLAREVDRTGRINLPRFWGRRFLRLGPAYGLYVGALSVAFLAGVGWRRPSGGWTPPGYLGSLWGYYSNYLPAGGIWEHQWLSMHLWSLAVEEQYYLIWPLLCAAALPRRLGEPLAWLLVAAVLVCRHLSPGDLLMTHLDTRGVGIILGSAVALSTAARGRPRLARALGSGRLRWWVAALVLVAILSLRSAAIAGKIDMLFLARTAIPRWT